MPNWKNLAASSDFGRRQLAAPCGRRQAFRRSEYGRGPERRETPSGGCAPGGCLQRHIDVLEEGPRSNATNPFRGLNEVVTGLAGMFAAESVGENEGLGKLAGSNNEARSVNGPCTFNLHKTSPVGGRAVASCAFLIGGYWCQVFAKVLRPIATARSWFPGAK